MPLKRQATTTPLTAEHLKSGPTKWNWKSRAQKCKNQQTTAALGKAASCNFHLNLEVQIHTLQVTKGPDIPPPIKITFTWNSHPINLSQQHLVTECIIKTGHNFTVSRQLTDGNKLQQTLALTIWEKQKCTQQLKWKLLRSNGNVHCKTQRLLQW